VIKKEFEKKLIICENDYIILLQELGKHFEREYILQINYYYDTLDFDIFYSDETLRVRQINDVLKLQYKYNKNYSGDIRISDEYSEKISELPQTILINGIITHNIGLMVTERINFKLLNCVISLDKNYYLGMIDYEIEVETTNEINLPDILQNLNFNIDGKGKYSRYIEKLLKQEFNYKLRK